jgi:hypothetical protein
MYDVYVLQSSFCAEVLVCLNSEIVLNKAGGPSAKSGRAFLI